MELWRTLYEEALDWAVRFSNVVQKCDYYNDEKKKKLFVLISINKKSIMIKKKTQGNNSMLQKRIKLVTPVYPEKSWHKHTKWACYILYQTHYGFKTIFIVYISSQNLVSNIFYDVKLAHNVFPQLIYPRGLHE